MSTCSQIWEMKDHFSGDTFKEKIITLKNDDDTPIDITDCTFLFQFRKAKIGLNDNPVSFFWSSSDDSIEIVDAENGELKLNKKIISVDPTDYVSDFQITYANGDVETLFSAKIRVIQSISD
jgi:hypothetical protein